jgi:hypothetical protein
VILTPDEVPVSSKKVLRIRDVFIPDPDPTIFSSRIQTFFHPGSRILHEKWNAILLLFVLLLMLSGAKTSVIVKEIRDPEKIHPGSGGKKTPDPGSTTLLENKSCTGELYEKKRAWQQS